MTVQIKKINKVKNFGVFENFVWPSVLPEFTFKNVIYGWNYSGKTTFSRILQCLERKSIHSDFGAGEMEIQMSDGTNITDKDLAQVNFPVRVFNSDFVKRNFKWDESKLEAILLLGEENITTQGLIEQKSNLVQEKRTESASKKDKSGKITNALNEEKSNLAKQLTASLSLGRNFIRTHVDALINGLGESFEVALITDEAKLRVKNQQAIARPEDNLPEIQLTKPSNQFPELFQSTKELIEFVTVFSNASERIRTNKALSDWLETGLPLHEEASNCEFCGEVLQPTRIEELRGYFSKEYSQHKAKLTLLLSKLKSASISTPVQRANDFYAQYRQEFDETSKKLKSVIGKQNVEIEKLKTLVESKIEDPFSIPSGLEVITDNFVELLVSFADLERLVLKHNEASQEFDKRQKAAVEELKSHHVAVYMKDNKYLQRTEEAKQLLIESNELEKVKSDLEKEIELLKSQISSSEKGRKELNDFISSFLGKDEIQIKVVPDSAGDRFVLMRGEKLAKNLSEGEKTAIAFSHFLVKLREIPDFENLIVCIDDPISSLDHNHIFQINSILKELFFHKIPTPNDSSNEMWALKCSQIFLSTHSFEFMGLLKEIPTKDYNGEKSKKTSFYLFQTSLNAQCNISKLPKVLRQTDTEYHYLFSLIEDFDKSHDRGNYENLMILPNAVRRFVELYTYSKLPLPGEVDRRAEKVFGSEKSKRILKVLHYFSHAQFSRLNKHNDLICDIENAISDILEFLEKEDPAHIEALRSQA